MSKHEEIITRCPSCSSRGTLFVGTGGHLTCSVIDCPEPSVGDAITRLRGKVHIAEVLVEEYTSSFALYDAACLRGIKLWQEETGRTHLHPDIAILVAWLLSRLSAADKFEEGMKIMLRMMANSKDAQVMARHEIEKKGWEWKEKK